MHPVARRLDESLKRTIDLTASMVALTWLAVPFAALGVAIKLDSPGPVFYRGSRVGRGGRPFKLFKFRSMVPTTGGATSTTRDDPRLTRVGRFMRRYKIDELPQLINVFLGDMSLVGPRPQVEWCVQLFSPEERATLGVRPGITDWASMRFHNEEEIIAQSGIADADEAYMQVIHPEKTRLQLEYVRSRSVLVDLEIIFATLGTLIRTRTSAQVATEAATPSANHSQGAQAST